VAAALNRLGGERAALAPVTNAKAMTPVIDGLAVRSRLIVIEGGDSVFRARFVKPGWAGPHSLVLTPVSSARRGARRRCS